MMSSTSNVCVFALADREHQPNCAQTVNFGDWPQPTTTGRSAIGMSWKLRVLVEQRDCKFGGPRLTQQITQLSLRRSETKRKWSAENVIRALSAVGDDFWLRLALPFSFYVNNHFHLPFPQYTHSLNLIPCFCIRFLLKSTTFPTQNQDVSNLCSINSDHSLMKLDLELMM